MNTSGSANTRVTQFRPQIRALAELRETQANFTTGGDVSCNDRLMRIWVLRETDKAPAGAEDVLLLRQNDWNDWWKYRTLFHATYVDRKMLQHSLGLVKIGQFDLPLPSRGEPISPALPKHAARFDESLFSVGQDEIYYENLNGLGQRKREQLLRVMRDIAFDHDLLERAVAEDITQESLLRDVRLNTVRGQFSRMARGGARLTEYDFVWHTVDAVGVSKPLLEFAVVPESMPPTNIHAVIGRNGVGKSTLLNRMASNLVHSDQERGDFQTPDGNPFTEFNNLVSVSFSAFDDFDPLERTDDLKRLNYSYIGLNQPSSGSEVLGDKPSQLDGLIDAVGACLFASRRGRWLAALALLENDPVFRDVGLVSLIEDGSNEQIIDTLRRDVFGRLSSGHKIVLISVTRLVATVEERTLVLIDEPEAHLHPPLLSAYVRALSALMTDRNGVAIVATHSPVVLQELPRTCVWKISRSRDRIAAERPDIETFGENVGRLTNDVFGLEVTATGFHGLLTELALQNTTYEAALARLNGQLGVEGRSILRSRVITDSSSEV